MRNKHDTRPLSQQEREEILAVALKRMVMIDGKVFGLEDDAEQESIVDCAAKTVLCRANCCTYVFALTQEEVKKGIYKYDPERPYYMAKDPDGYCSHLDRVTFRCSIHDNRPSRCRRFACPESDRP